MHTLWYIFVHMTGIDTQQSRYYDFWSGIATQASVAAAIVAFYIHRNCHVKGCLRLGHTDPAHGFPACKRHHSKVNQLGTNPNAIS